jgi:hypothetical protein
MRRTSLAPRTANWHLPRHDSRHTGINLSRVQIAYISGIELIVGPIVFALVELGSMASVGPRNADLLSDCALTLVGHHIATVEEAVATLGSGSGV